MAVRLIYESGVSGQTTDITSYLRLYTLNVSENAEEGAVGMSEYVLDDPDGDLDIVAWRRMWAYEDTATGSNTLIHYGWVADKTIERGPSHVEAGRQWRVSVVDQNAVLSFRVFSFDQANRPAERDVERVDWLMGVVGSFGRAPITVDEFTFGAGGVQMDAVDYRGQTVLDILDDCAQQSGKNYYCYTKDNGYPASQPTRGIWYGSTEHTAYDSPIRLSNVLSDIDSVWTFAIANDTQLERRGDRVYSGVFGQYDGGQVYEQLASTYDNFTQRDIIVPMPNVKTLGGATRRADRMLADLDEEDDRITTAAWIPRAKVNFLKPGMRVRFRAQHLPGYANQFVWLRVLSITKQEVAEGDGDDTGYIVSMTLSASSPPSDITCGDLALTQDSGYSYLTAVNTLPVAPSNCLQVWVETVRTSPPDSGGPGAVPVGFTVAGWAFADGAGNEGRIKIAYRITQPGDPVTFTSLDSGGDRSHIVYEFGGVDRLIDVASADTQPNASSITSASVSTGSGRGVLIGVFMKTDSGPAGGNTLPDLAISAPATQSYDEVGTLVSHDQGPTSIVGYRTFPSGGSGTISATGSSTGFATGTWCYVVAGFGE